MGHLLTMTLVTLEDSIKTYYCPKEHKGIDDANKNTGGPKYDACPSGPILLGCGGDQ
jgi:hypothetical protein